MFSKEWINPNRVKFFSLLDYVSQIELDKNILYHVEDVENSFRDYIKSLTNCCDIDDSSTIANWLDDNQSEISNSVKRFYTMSDMLDEDIYFNREDISHSNIKRIHSFICNYSNTNAKLVGEYRTDIASVGVMLDNGTYQPFWYGAEVEDINRFIDSFIEYYKYSDNNEIFNNPFIRSTLVHLLLMRIHPFGDANSRTSSILQDISFTTEINKINNTNMKIIPLNVAYSVDMYRNNFADIRNRIYFDLDHKEENNIAINKWIDFILNMYDEQLYFQTSKLSKLNK